MFRLFAVFAFLFGAICFFTVVILELSGANEFSPLMTGLVFGGVTFGIVGEAMHLLARYNDRKSLCADPEYPLSLTQEQLECLDALLDDIVDADGENCDTEVTVLEKVRVILDPLRETEEEEDEEN